MIAFCIKKISKNKLLILHYHRIQDQKNIFCNEPIDQNSFDWQMHLLSGYLIPVGLSDALQKLKKDQLSGGSIVITFDDGYKDNYTHVLPILQKRNIKATFFITTGFLNGGIMWNDIIVESIKFTQKNKIDLHKIGLKEYSLASKEDKINAIEDIIHYIKYKPLYERNNFTKEIQYICGINPINDLMMTDNELIKLFQSDMEIGAHTVNHPILLSEEDSIVKKEIIESKSYLENLLQIPITLFAYPNGKLGKDYDHKHFQILKEAGFDYAITTNWGINTKKSNMLELKRFTPWDKTKIRFLLRILKIYFFGKV